eukprot:gene29957-18022_t
MYVVFTAAESKRPLHVRSLSAASAQIAASPNTLTPCMSWRKLNGLAHVVAQAVSSPLIPPTSTLSTPGIVHRDIKPDNVLFMSDLTLKLADFGLAIDLTEERANTRAGTLDYMAPEVLRCPQKDSPDEGKCTNIPTDLEYTAEVDLWAMGVFAYEILTGVAPYHST